MANDLALSPSRISGGLWHRGQWYPQGAPLPAIDTRVNGNGQQDDNPTGMPPGRGNFVMPHVITFQGLISSLAKVYRNPDEAIKNSLDNAIYMRSDLTIMECLDARQRSTALLNWHLEVEGEKDGKGKYGDLLSEMTQIMRQIPYFTELRRSMLDAIWYGKQGAQFKYRWMYLNGVRRVVIDDWVPINGDKLVFRYDDGKNDRGPAGQLGIRVMASTNATATDSASIKLPKVSTELSRTANSYREAPIEEMHGLDLTHFGWAYFLNEEERSRIAVHRHMIEDSAYETPIDAGAIHGIGARSRIYWTWFQKQETLGFLMEYIERSALGIEIWYYPYGNPNAEAKVRTAAEQRIGNGRNIIMVPRMMGEAGELFGIERIDPSAAGSESLKSIVTDLFGAQMKRFLLGQTLTSEAAATGLGSGVADLHLDTYLQIIKYDSTNLEETITRQIVRTLLRYNFPEYGEVPIRFVIETETPDIDSKLAAWERAYNMGLKIPSRSVYEAIGAAMPTTTDDVLWNPQSIPQQPGMMGGQPGQPAPGGQPGQPAMGDQGQGQGPSLVPPQQAAPPFAGGGMSAAEAANQGDDTELYQRSPDKYAATPSPAATAKPVPPQTQPVPKIEHPSPEGIVLSPRQEGETDKAFAKRAIDPGPAVTHLPEEHEKYFNTHLAHAYVPVGNLVPSKSEDQTNISGQNATKRMRASYYGHLSKRDPIEVTHLGDGRYRVEDGNSTLAAARYFGWKTLPVIMRQQQPETASPTSNQTFSGIRAPQGGARVGGKFFRTGQWIGADHFTHDRDGAAAYAAIQQGQPWRSEEGPSGFHVTAGYDEHGNMPPDPDLANSIGHLSSYYGRENLEKAAVASLDAADQGYEAWKDWGRGEENPVKRHAIKVDQASQFADICARTTAAAWTFGPYATNREGQWRQKRVDSYSRAARAVFSRMSEESLDRFRAAASYINFEPSLDDINQQSNRLGLGKALAFVNGNEYKYKDGSDGYYGRGNRSGKHAVLDGGSRGVDVAPENAQAEQESIKHIYAHEFAHIIDEGYPEGMSEASKSNPYQQRIKISDTSEWGQAWIKEIDASVNGENRLTRYARVDPAEGFAEFFRLTLMNPHVARSHFPACWKVLHDHGIVEIPPLSDPESLTRRDMIKTRPTRQEAAMPLHVDRENEIEAEATKKQMQGA